jgi:hypothetical protein
MTLPPHNVDELLWWMDRIVRRPSATQWEREFAASMVKAGRRRGWMPTPKQEAVMRRLVLDRLGGTERAVETPDEFEVIDRAA